MTVSGVPGHWAARWGCLQPARVRTTGGTVAPGRTGWQPPVVAWHTSWRYFAEYTGMNIVGFMEPKPGVPPSPAHLAGLIQTMKQSGAKVIIMEPFYDKKTADFVASKTGAKVLVLPPSVGGAKGLDDYIQLMTSDIHQLATIHQGLAQSEMLPAQHLVDAGYVRAQNLVEAREH